MTKSPHFELFAGGHGFYWRLRAHNKRVIADGAEPYSTKRSARRAVDRIQRLMLPRLAVKFLW